MPYENEHSCRLNPPGKYSRFARKNCDQKHDGKCIDVIYGILDSDSSEVQALRFNKDVWTAQAAAAVCKSREGDFEPAKKTERAETLTSADIKGCTIEYTFNELNNTDQYIPTDNLREAIFPTRELRLHGDIIEGYAAVFNQLAEITPGRFEEFAPGAFSESIKVDDIKLLINHDPNYVLGRTKNNTLELREDEYGLKIICTPPQTTFAKDLIEQIKRGDINQMSIGFTIKNIERKERDGKKIERVLGAKLFDVSVVTFPAYPQTNVEVKDSLIQTRKKILDCLEKL